jgi:coenzyme F420-reducing hydrogenase alpha subunit
MATSPPRGGRSRTIRVDMLARVEGEGALRLQVRRGQVTAAELRIFEPPRFFEAFLRGRAAAEAPDITARICGICPVAYQMSAVHALEAIAGVVLPPPLDRLRRLLYCGEWIESHALHIYMLHAPDFLGYPSGIALAKDEPDRVRAGLALKQAGNEILRVVGGREIHPINVRLGGFYRAPSRGELQALREPLLRARDIAVETVAWVAGFPFPALERDYRFVALLHPGEYPMNHGEVATSTGLRVPATEFPDHFSEQQVPHSNALQARASDGAAYLTGPLARYALNALRLRPVAREAAAMAGLGRECRNPYQAIIVRAVEVLHACDEALQIIDEYVEPDVPAVAVALAAGTGHACTEAPRGLLYHRYRLAADGLIAEACIVPPTSQNQATIEDDLREFAAGWLDLPDTELRDRCERVIRNHDPCISCATHFLRLTVERDAGVASAGDPG